MCGTAIRDAGDEASTTAPTAPVFGSDVASAWSILRSATPSAPASADAVQLRGGDALQRMPPGDLRGVMLVNPPYGERIEVAGVAGAARADACQQAVARFGARESAQMDSDEGGEFFSQLAAHWKKNYAGWTAWVLTPDLKLPGRCA